MKTIAQGIIRKMRTRLEQPVRYGARFGDEEVPFNPFL
ncbi:MAG TPA: DUF2797 domain-containing protein, partial [Gammaproteobacteria bacterium]|nr:DUF2797 domain-containing protein [Gammaproteobacteria bacterium]